MPDTDATRQSDARQESDVPEPSPPSPRLYSLTTRYTDQYLGGQDGPDLLCDDAVTALHFALTTSSSSPLALTCTTSTDGRTWTRLPLHALRTDAFNALRQDMKPPMYPAPMYPDPRTSPRADLRRPREALSRLIEHSEAAWLDSVLRVPVDEASTWVPDEPATADWIRAGRLWAAVWGEPPSDVVLDRLPFPTDTSSATRGITLLRAQATAVLDAEALAHDPAAYDSLADLHAAWRLLHGLNAPTLEAKYGPGTDLRTAEHLLLERITALHPDTAATLAATRDHPDTARIQNAAHTYLRQILPLWPQTADWTVRARTTYREELHALRTTKTGPSPSPGPPETPAQAVLRTVLTALPEPTPLTRHEAASRWRSHSGRAAEQAGWDAAVQTNRTHDLARAHTTGGTAQDRGEAIALAQRALTAVARYHDEHLTTHAARGHLHTLAATLVTLDKAQRTLQHGIWDIAAERRAQHDHASRPWNGHDEQQCIADLTPVLTDGEAHIAHLRRRHLDAAHHALTSLIPELTDTPRHDHRHHMMRDYLAPLDLLRQDLNTLGSHIDTKRRTCTELRTRLNSGPQFGQQHATDHYLAVAEKQLRNLEQRYADTQIEFALSVTLARTFEQVRTPAPPEVPAAAPSPSSRRTAPTTQRGHDQATAAALLPGPSVHGRTTGT